MEKQPDLTDEEWAMIAELLERERRDLHPEIRHTDTSTVRDELRGRLARIEGLLRKLGAGVAD